MTFTVATPSSSTSYKNTHENIYNIQSFRLWLKKMEKNSTALELKKIVFLIKFTFDSISFS